jgi:chromosome segregation ATPase
MSEVSLAKDVGRLEEKVSQLQQTMEAAFRTVQQQASQIAALEKRASVMEGELKRLTQNLPEQSDG